MSNTSLEERTIMPSTPPCRVCKGSGKIPIEDGLKRPREKKIPCPKCGGRK